MYLNVVQIRSHDAVASVELTIFRVSNATIDDFIMVNERLMNWEELGSKNIIALHFL